MAVGDITNITLGNGWIANITISGFVTGVGYYQPGFNEPYHRLVGGSPKCSFSVLSSGFDDGGDPTTISRVVYGTTGIRQPAPNDTFRDEVYDGNGNLLIKVALSDFVYQKDQITANIGTGFYVCNGTGNSLLSGYSVTNTLTNQYPKTVANWSYPGWWRITGQSFRLRAVAFNRFGQQGKPVKTVIFSGRDTVGNIVTGVTNNMVIDTTLPDPVPVCEYIYDLSSASLRTGDLITCNFKAYPWVGDAGSVLDTSDGKYNQPTPFYAPIYLLNDKSGNYGQTVVVVDPVNGTNNGQAIDLTGFNSGSPPAAYSSIFSGVRAILNYNNTFRGRNDTGGGIVYLRSGNHIWMGGSSTYGNVPNTYLTFTNFPADVRESVHLTGVLSNTNPGGRYKVENVFIENKSALSMFDGSNSGCWYNNCLINTSGAGTWGAVRVAYFTHNNIPNVAQGIKYFALNNMAPAIVRGNTFINTPAISMTTYTALGNFRSGIVTSLICAQGLAATSQPCPTGDNTILAFNYFGNHSGATSVLSFFGFSGEGCSGAAIVQNMVETHNINSQPAALLAGDSSVETEINNVIIWHNTIVGQRMNSMYNDDNPIPKNRYNWSYKNNIIGNFNIKSDTFTHGTYGANSNRTGNWPCMYGVGFGGNITNKTIGYATNGFLPNFGGINNVQSGDGNGQASSFLSPTGFEGFINPRFANGGIAGTPGGGLGGNYRLLATSPAANFPTDFLLPYDIAGNPRTAGDAAGVYTYSASSGPVVFVNSSGVIYSLYLGPSHQFNYINMARGMQNF